MQKLSKTLFLIVCLICLVIGLSCYAGETTKKQQYEYIWTDSLKSVKRRFAVPPEWAKTIEINKKQYLSGGVFVIPGTPVNLLSKNGFIEIKKQKGSFIHDYYAAKWPEDISLDSLPNEIRQVKYSTDFSAEHIDSNTVTHKIDGKTYVSVELFVIPNTPLILLKALGIKRINYIKSGQQFDKYSVDWPIDLSNDKVPPEVVSFFLQRIDLPNDQLK